MTSPTLSSAKRLTAGPTVKVSVSPFSARSVTERVAWSMAVIVTVAVTSFCLITV